MENRNNIKQNQEENKINKMCLNCEKYGGECNGTTEKVWTGCIFRRTTEEK